MHTFFSLNSPKPSKFTDNDGVSRQRLVLYITYYLTMSTSSTSMAVPVQMKHAFKSVIELEFTQSAGREFQQLMTLVIKNKFVNLKVYS